MAPWWFWGAPPPPPPQAKTQSECPPITFPFLSPCVQVGACLL